MSALHVPVEDWFPADLKTAAEALNRKVDRLLQGYHTTRRPDETRRLEAFELAIREATAVFWSQYHAAAEKAAAEAEAAIGPSALVESALETRLAELDVLDRAPDWLLDQAAGEPIERRDALRAKAGDHARAQHNSDRIKSLRHQLGRMH